MDVPVIITPIVYSFEFVSFLQHRDLRVLSSIILMQIP